MRGLAIVFAVAVGCFFEPVRPLDSDTRTDARLGDGPGDGPGGDGVQDADVLGIPNYVFVTSGPLSLAGSADKLMTGDTLCNYSAMHSAPQLVGYYHAWLSESSNAAVDRLGNARGWVRPDNAAVADTIAELITTGPRTQIRLDENGTDALIPTPISVATGTGANGQPGGDDATCPGGNITIGHPDGSGARWTDDGYVPCSQTNLHLYCFGYTRNVVVP